MLPADLSTLKVVDLRAELSNRDLSTKGKKDELIERLQEFLNNADAAEEPTTDNVEASAVEEPLVEVSVVETPVVEVTGTELAEKTESVVIEKTESIVIEKTELPVVEHEVPVIEETIVEKTATSTVNTPVIIAPIIKTPAVKSPSVDTPVENPKVADTPKDNMDTDRTTKRRRSIEPVTTQEKRAKVDLDSSALYVKGFVRPLIIRAVNELFGKYGTVKRFWMDSIKTHCYVTYETVEEARTAFQNINGIVFPKDTGKSLSVGGLTPDQVEQLIEYEQAAAERRLRVDWEASVEKVKAGGSLPTSSAADNTRKARSIGIGQIAKQLAQAAEPVVAPSRQAEIIRPPKERTLEDLFCKTKALPHLYYLPVSEEEAKIKLSQIQSL